MSQSVKDERISKITNLSINVLTQGIKELENIDDDKARLMINYFKTYQEFLEGKRILGGGLKSKRRKHFKSNRRRRIQRSRRRR